LLSEFRKNHLPKQIEPKGQIPAIIDEAPANIMNPGLPQFARNRLDIGNECSKTSQRYVAQACRLGFRVSVPGFGQIAGHGSERDFKEMAIFRLLAAYSQGLRFASTYCRQTELLKKLHKQTDQEVSVARFLLGQDESTGEAFSYCLWCPDLPILLPHVDRVAFMEEEDDRPMLVDWDRVCEAVGHLMEPQGMYPERYRVEDYPYGHILEKLGG
jgi:hypothetical protein